MRQVPNYGIIGAGRVAKHMLHYLALLGLPAQQWSRYQSRAALAQLINQSDRILLLIKDDAIDAFYNEHQSVLAHKRCIHFSGAKPSAEIFAVHPLMTFGEALYDLPTYQKIPFVLDQSELNFSELLPGLANAHYIISSEQKSLYHAYCVISNNFSMLLWNEFMHKLQHEFNIPKAAALPILQQTFSNLAASGEVPLTGPLVRNDLKTINTHLQALKQDKLEPIYQSFLEVYASFNHLENDHENSA